MRLPSGDPEVVDESRRQMDRGTDRLTSIWANDRGFLFGIAGILFIAAFYLQVFLSGGIESQY